MASLARRIPSADKNSVTTTSAPNDRHSRLKGDSETPAIGARYSGTVFAVANGNGSAIRGNLTDAEKSCNIKI